jgi:arsenate reductase
MEATIYHNPRCGTSRSALELMRSAGIEPTVIEYLKDPPSRAELAELVAKLGGSARAVLRDKEDLAGELELRDPAVDDEVLLDAMAAHPILLNRPIVITAKGARLCRPAETVRELLP